MTHYILQNEELAFGVFNTSGEQLWETFVSPPYDFEIINDHIILKDCDSSRKISIQSGQVVE